MLIPRGVRTHFEVELGVVLGQRVTDLPESTTAAELAPLLRSYCLAIDMTARNVQDEAKAKGLPWSIAKGFDTFLPLSDEIAPSLIPDPHDVHLSLSVNGEAKQSDSTQLMLFNIPTMLSHISRCMTLEPGDLVLTGTPKGVGEVKPGDVMTALLQVAGKEVARIDVEAKDKGGLYSFAET